MVADHFHLAHSMLSPYLNNGLLLAGEVADRAEAAYRAGAVPLASAEGFIRQLIGWREYVWGLYWFEPPSYASMNELGAIRPLPMAFTGAVETRMACVEACLDGIDERSWLHHIQRLMVLGNPVSERRPLIPEGGQILLAGDAFGVPKTEGAFLSGLAAAAQIAVLGA